MFPELWTPMTRPLSSFWQVVLSPCWLMGWTVPHHGVSGPTKVWDSVTVRFLRVLFSRKHGNTVKKSYLMDLSFPKSSSPIGKTCVPDTKSWEVVGGPKETGLFGVFLDRASPHYYILHSIQAETFQSMQRGEYLTDNNRDCPLNQCMTWAGLWSLPKVLLLIFLLSFPQGTYGLLPR